MFPLLRWGPAYILLLSAPPGVGDSHQWWNSVRDPVVRHRGGSGTAGGELWVDCGTGDTDGACRDATREWSAPGHC
ncbi:hypothetical protein NDU88_009603 [Pleurodeles waltl]|uniref:Secreted protein n=1 Tax=Pleurodeles waltl TaxID=8319 RepID=A0AAV7RWK3_PLEWA|nr:hypothetical protein NDU88_009603 [Pleurodeles waltl]